MDTRMRVAIVHIVLIVTVVKFARTMMSRRKFKIMYPTKDGKQYKPPQGCMVVMNNQGIFFQVDMADFYLDIRKLSDILTQYDVVWKD